MDGPLKLRVAALVVTTAIGVCMAVSVGVPQWCTVREFESQTKQYFTGYYGLFKDCSTLEDITRCQTYADDALTVWRQVAQSFGIAAVIIIVGAGLCFGYHMRSSRGSWLFAAVFGVALSLTSLIVCTTVFMINIDVLDGGYPVKKNGASFCIGIVAMVLCVVDTIIMMVYKRAAKISNHQFCPINCISNQRYGNVEEEDVENEDVDEETVRANLIDKV